MVSANIAIINDLREYLQKVLRSSEFRKEFVVSQGDFTRKRQLPLERIVGIILNMSKRSLRIELRDFFSHLPQGDPCVGKSAFCMQRAKLKPNFFECWNKTLVSSFYRHYGQRAQCWRGHLLHAVDGSKAYLVNTPEIIDHFGTQENQYTSVAMAQLMQIHDVLNNIIVWAEMAPVKIPEQSLMMSHISRLHKDAITLFDRGYPSFALIYMLENRPAPNLFIMRCKTRFNRVVSEFAESPEKDIITYFSPSAQALETLKEYGYCLTGEPTVKVRLVKIELPAQAGTEILITNLYDKDEFSLQDLSYLYSLPWTVETSFGIQKNVQQIEQFSGHRVICIQQDYLASVFVYNIQSLIEKQSEKYLKAVSRKRKYSYKINRNVSLGALKNTLFLLFFKKETKQILLYLQHLFESALEPVRPGRKYKRKKVAKRLNGKYQIRTNYKRAI